MNDPPFPAYRGTDPYVFVCYAHDDSGLVFPELGWLRDQGVNVWYDEGISPGAEWSQSIADAIEGCERVLFYVSSRSVDSEHCRREISFAQAKGRPVNVVHLEETVLPGSLELSLSNRQAVLRHQLQETSYQEKLLQAAVGEEARVALMKAPGRQPRSRKALVLGVVCAVVAGVAAVLWTGTTGPESTEHPATAIAVIPFDDLSPDGDQRWLANGMAEALVVYLSRIEQLRVAQAPPGSTHVPDPRALGSALEVGSVVLGSVQRIGEALQVTARLIDTSDGTQLWSARYDRVLDDVFDVQQEVAAAIVRAIEAELGIELPLEIAAAFNEARYGARDVRAYELWRKAIDLKFFDSAGSPTDGDLHKALQYNLEAVAIDPDFAMGHVGVGASYQFLWTRTRDLRDREAAKKAFERAVELDGRNAIAAGNRAAIAAEDGEWTKVVEMVGNAEPWTGVADVGRAFFGYLVALINLGRWDDAEAALDELTMLVRRAPDRFPLDRFIHAELAWGMVLVRRDYDGVVEQLEPARGADVRWWPVAAPMAVAAYRATNREEEALESFLDGLAESDRVDASRGYAEGGWLEMLRGVIESGRKQGETCPVHMARTYAELGDVEQMFECLETPRVGMIGDLNWTLPQFDPYRDEPRFQALLDRMNIVGYKTCCPFTIENGP